MKNVNAKLDYIDKEILKYLKKNTKEALKLGVRGVANKVNTTPSRVMRIAKKLNYSGFIEMLYSFKDNYSIAYDQLTIEIRKKFFFRVRNSNEIDEFLSLINSSKIAIYGEGFSSIVSKYIYQKFLVLGIESIHILWMDASLLIKNKVEIDLILIISKSGDTEACYEFAKTIKELGGKVASFTGNNKSRISEISDYAFYFEDIFKDDDDIFYPNPFFGYCIIGFEELISKYFERYIVKNDFQNIKKVYT